MLFKLVQGLIEQLFKIVQQTFSAVQQRLVGVVQQLFKVVSATVVLVILVQQGVVQGCPEHCVQGCPTAVLRGNLVLCGPGCSYRWFQRLCRSDIVQGNSLSSLFNSCWDGMFSVSAVSVSLVTRDCDHG